MMIRIIMPLFILFIVSSTSFAGRLSYACKIIHVYDLDDDGSLRTSGWEEQFKDCEFSVSRVTGEIIGEVIPTLLANSKKVINIGNEKYSFESIADFDAVNKPLSTGTERSEDTAGVQLLHIEEFRHGDRKPFVAMSMGGAGIVTGLCK